MQAKTSIINRQWCQTGSNQQLRTSKKKGGTTTITGIVKFKGQSVTHKFKAAFI